MVAADIISNVQAEGEARRAEAEVIAKQEATKAIMANSGHSRLRILADPATIQRRLAKHRKEVEAWHRAKAAADAPATAAAAENSADLKRRHVEHCAGIAGEALDAGAHLSEKEVKMFFRQCNPRHPARRLEMPRV